MPTVFQIRQMEALKITSCFLKGDIYTKDNTFGFQIITMADERVGINFFYRGHQITTCVLSQSETALYNLRGFSNNPPSHEGSLVFTNMQTGESRVLTTIQFNSQSSWYGFVKLFKEMEILSVKYPNLTICRKNSKYWDPKLELESKLPPLQSMFGTEEELEKLKEKFLISFNSIPNTKPSEITSKLESVCSTQLTRLENVRKNANSSATNFKTEHPEPFLGSQLAPMFLEPSSKKPSITLSKIDKKMSKKPTLIILPPMHSLRYHKTILPSFTSILPNFQIKGSGFDTVLAMGRQPARSMEIPSAKPTKIVPWYASNYSLLTCIPKTTSEPEQKISTKEDNF